MSKRVWCRRSRGLKRSVQGADGVTQTRDGGEYTERRPQSIQSVLQCTRFTSSTANR